MKLTVNKNSITGRIKPMNAVNNGPVYTENADQNLTNMPYFIDANIPYARTHDSSICYDYGGEHCVDIIGIFPNFEKDENDPNSYDFTLTDMYLKNIERSGAQVFFRLGNKIEHWPKHYGIIPPKDYKKWAVICEHIINHYNYGWADGFKMGIKYWEIWNEPDFNNKCWLGTPEEFYELFAVTAKHLKSKFPSLKIGGPAVCCYNEKWLVPFFEYMHEHGVPMDFYSWHRYSDKIEDFTIDAERHRKLLDKYGYTETESILNEWNYVVGWEGQTWKKSLIEMNSVKGAVFCAAVMAQCQKSSADMLMYYDARIQSSMNNLFDRNTLEPKKGYYPVKLWGEMLKMGAECKTECDIPDIYAASAVGNGKSVTMIAYYSADDRAVTRSFKIDFGKNEKDRLYSIFTLDEDKDFELTETCASDNGEFFITMKPNTVIAIR